MLKVLIFTGLRNTKLTRIRLQVVELDQGHVHVVQGKGGRERTVLFSTSFRGELLQYRQRWRALLVYHDQIRRKVE